MLGFFSSILCFQAPNFRVLSLAFRLFTLALLIGCAIWEQFPKHTAPILIGAVLPFSGGVELYGWQAQVGLDLAASEIKASGSILRHPVEIT